MYNFTKCLLLIVFFPVSSLWAQATLLNPLNTVTNGSLQSAETVVNNGLYYVTATDGVHGHELWRTDGTPAGTFMLKDINPNPESYDSPYNFKGLGDQVFFVANDSIHGYELWATDGSIAGTRLVKDLDTIPGQGVSISSMVEMQGKLYFAASLYSLGQELWVSDGTADGTHVVRDIVPGPSSGVRSYDIAVFNNHIFFAGRETFSNTELWVSDGTELGTYELKDIQAGNGSSMDYNDHLISTPFGVFFTANDGVHGSELWFSNGDSLQTRMVKDINPSTEDPGVYLVPDFEDYAVYNNKLLFMGRSGANVGEELWITDGTPNGTVLLKAFENEHQGDAEAFRVAPQGVFFRTYETSTGRELYFTDGTSAGTHLVADLNPGSPNGVSPNAMQVAGNKVYFGAGNYFIGAGVEMWSSDGSAAGTTLFLDLNTGSDSSFPNAINLLGDQLIFTGTKPTISEGLYKATVNTVSVADFNRSEIPLHVWPQPGSDQVRIALENEDQVIDQIVLVYPNGIHTLLSKNSTNQYEWNCSQLPNGLYVLLVYVGKKMTIKKVIVQH